jgi:hypothetical protein
VVVARGGGPAYELHQFNQPCVLDAIAEAVCRKFVVTAIGHTEDETLADKLASRAEAVPATAALFLVSQRIKFQEETGRQVSPRPDRKATPTVAGDVQPPAALTPAAPAKVGAARLQRLRAWLLRWTRRAAIFGAGATVGMVAAPALRPQKMSPQTDIQSAPMPSGSVSRETGSVPGPRMPGKAVAKPDRAPRKTRDRAAGNSLGTGAP